MTVSTLIEMETCPRRWALTSADYTALWSGRGYPPRIHLSSLAGTVIHLVLETLTRELARSGCSSIEDAATAQVMRDLGGYTRVVQTCLDQVIARLTENPRAPKFVQQVIRSLRAQVPDLRIRTQMLLGRVRLPAVERAARGDGPRSRRALPNGLFPETELRAKQIGWKGRADILLLSQNICQIIDFKTGAKDDSHPFQIHVYALLWSRDDELNPSGRLADRLTLAYSHEDISVPAPSATQLGTLEGELVARSDAARRAVAARPPEARPSEENCRFCEVRHLCDVYWSSDVRNSLGHSRIGSKSVDLEILIAQRHGPMSWDGVVIVGPPATAGRPIILRTPDTPIDTRGGDRLRLLNVLLEPPESDEVPLLAIITSASEVFRVR